MSDPELPLPGCDWDNPRPSDAPSPDLVDLVATLTLMGKHLPTLIVSMGELREAIPKFSRDALLGELPPDRWTAMAALCDEPGRLLLDLGALCRKQACPTTAPAGGRGPEKKFREKSWEVSIPS